MEIHLLGILKPEFNNLFLVRSAESSGYLRYPVHLWITVRNVLLKFIGEPFGKYGFIFYQYDYPHVGERIV